MLLATIKERSLSARKLKDTVQANLLGLILADVQNRAKEQHRDPSEEDVIAAVKSARKKNAQAIDIASTEQLLKEKALLEEIPLPEVPAPTADEIRAILFKLAQDNPDKYEATKGNPKNRGWFVGQIMKATGGKAEQATVNSAIEAFFV